MKILQPASEDLHEDPTAHGAGRPATLGVQVKYSPWRTAAAAGIVAGGLCLLVAIFFLSLTKQSAASRDFIGYWAAGQQIVHGASPYGAVEVLRLEKAVGLGKLQIKITPSPPVGLALVIPLGFLDAKGGLIFWMVTQLACLSIALWILWIMQGRPNTRIHLLGYLFAPALACVMAGQLGIFCLLGVSVFLLWHDRRPFLAGVALLPLTLKPHLFLAAALVLLLWVAWRKTPRVLAGLVAAMAASYAAVFAFDRKVWPQYMGMLRSNIMQDRFAPTLSAYLRWDVSPGTVWLEYLPAAAGCMWALWYFWSRRDRWNWIEHGLVVLLVSVMCAPYAWLTDEAVLLPAVLLGVYRAIDLRRSLLPIAIFCAAALIELYTDVRITSWYYTWTTPAWLAWYLYATRSSVAKDQIAEAGAAVARE
ncbi:MAG: glycosyltransferase 87 family protein [Terracidiphilus sp.]